MVSEAKKGLEGAGGWDKALRWCYSPGSWWRYLEAEVWHDACVGCFLKLPAYLCPFLEAYPSVSSHTHWPLTTEFFIYLCLPVLPILAFLHSFPFRVGREVDPV